MPSLKSSKSTLFQWILDSGASNRMTSNTHASSHLFYLPQTIHILILDGIITNVKQAGTVNLGHDLLLKNVRYSPQFRRNVIFA